MNKLDEMRQTFKDEADQSRKDSRISAQMRKDRSAKIIAMIASIGIIISTIVITILKWLSWKSH